MEKKLVLELSDSLQEMRDKIEAFHYELLIDCLGVTESELEGANTKAFLLFTGIELMGARATYALSRGRFRIHFYSQEELDRSLEYYNSNIINWMVDDTDGWKDEGTYPYDFVCPHCQNKLVETGRFVGGLFTQSTSRESFLCLYCFKAYRKETIVVMTGKTSGPSLDEPEFEHKEGPLREINEPDFGGGIA